MRLRFYLRVRFHNQIESTMSNNVIPFVLCLWPSLPVLDLYRWRTLVARGAKSVGSFWCHVTLYVHWHWHHPTLFVPSLHWVSFICFVFIFISPKWFPMPPNLGLDTKFKSLACGMSRSKVTDFTIFSILRQIFHFRAHIEVQFLLVKSAPILLKI